MSDVDVAGVSDGPGQQRQELGDVRAARLGPVPDHHQPGRGPQRRDGESGKVHGTIGILLTRARVLTFVYRIAEQIIIVHLFD